MKFIFPFQLTVNAVCIAYDKFGIPNKLTLSIDIDLPSFIRDVEELPSFIASFIF